LYKIYQLEQFLIPFHPKRTGPKWVFIIGSSPEPIFKMIFVISFIRKRCLYIVTNSFNKTNVKTLLAKTIDVIVY